MKISCTRFNRAWAPLRRLALATVLSTGLAAGLTACHGTAGENAQTLAAGCGIAADQKKTFMAPVQLDQHVQVNLDPAFTQDQRLGVGQAVSAWNQVSNQLFRRNFYRMTTQAPETDGVPTGDADCGFDAPGAEAFSVMRLEDEGKWTAMGLTKNNPGVTVRCHQGGVLTKQVVLINTRHAQAAQFVSIVVHELGHALGLNHSCKVGSGSEGFGSCDGLKPDHPYRAAVMYPVLRIGASPTDLPEIKEDLRKNDSDRTSCLYGTR